MGRRHDHVLQTIDAAIQDLSPVDRLNFKEDEYVDMHGQMRRMIEVSEDGLFLVIGRMKGEAVTRSRTLVREIQASLATFPA